MKILFKFALLTFLLLTIEISVFAQKYGQGAIDSLQINLETSKPDTNRVWLIYGIAVEYQGIDADSAMAYAEQGLALSEELDYKKGISSFYNCIGVIHVNNSNLEEALKYLEKSYEINLEIGNTPKVISNLINMGVLYQNLGDFSTSQDYNLKALKIAEKEKDNDKYVALILTNIGNVYSYEKDYDKALSYHKQSLEKYAKLGNYEGLGLVTNKIANIYHNMDDLMEAEKFYNQSLSFYQKIGNRTGEAVTLSQLGLLFIDEDMDTHLDYLFKAQAIFDDTNPFHINSIINLGNIGGSYWDVYLDKMLESGIQYNHIPGNYDEVAKLAEDYTARAVEISEEAGNLAVMLTYLYNISMIQDERGDYKNAYTNFRRSTEIKDSIYSQESKNEIAAMEADYNMQKKEDEFKQQQQITDLKLRQLYLYGILIFVLLTSILLYLLNRSRIKGLRLKNELQRKDVEEKTKELLHRNKLSESELKAIRAQMNPHFIFNVLNSIESYVLENDSKTASRLIQKFSTLSRLILENSTQSLVVAEREWKALQLYTELEAMRFNNRFQYSFISDQGLDLSKLMIPPMLVQPLIENSIHHGVFDTSQSANQILVKIEDAFDNVIFTVEDNGPGIDETKQALNFSKVKTKSIGLAAIRERIEIISLLNGSATFVIRNKEVLEGRGTIAQLTLPKIYEFTAEQLSIPTSY